MPPTNPDRVSLARKRKQLERLREVEAERATLKDEADLLKAELIAAMGDATTGTIGKDVVFRLEIGTRQILDQRAFKAEQPEMHRKFLKTSTVKSYKLVDPE